VARGQDGETSHNILWCTLYHKSIFLHKRPCLVRHNHAKIDTHLILQLSLPLHQSTVLFLYPLLFLLCSFACCFPLLLYTTWPFSGLNSFLLCPQSKLQWHIQSFAMLTKPETFTQIPEYE
jgi:hypothetical protein